MSIKNDGAKTPP